MLVGKSPKESTITYSYGPFGEVIRATGPMAKSNPFRWSTKYTDDETDLVMYPRRPYSPSTGRWLSRDPIGEIGFDPTVTNRRQLREIENAQTRLQIMAVLQGEQLADFITRAAVMSNGSSDGSREDWLREEANLYAFCHNDPTDQIDPDGRVPVLLIFSTGKAISNGILACYDCYQLNKCVKRVREYSEQAAKGITDPEEYLKWLNAAKPGAECTPLLAACGKDVLMVGVWLGGRYLLLKYYAGGHY